MAGCTQTTWCCDIPPPQPCSQFDDSVRPVQPTEVTAAGFSLSEVAGHLIKTRLAEGSWASHPATVNMGPDLRVTFRPELNTAVEAQRPEGRGFSAFTEDGACPAGPLLRFEVPTTVSYEFDGRMAEWNVPLTVEVTGPDPSQMLFYGTSTIPIEQAGDALVELFSLIEAQERETLGRYAPRRKDRSALIVSLHGTPDDGLHEVKGVWNYASTTFWRYEWTAP